MTADELRAFCKQHALSGRLFARLTGIVEGRTVRRWLAGDSEIPGTVSQLVRLLNSMSAHTRKRAIEFLMTPPDA